MKKMSSCPLGVRRCCSAYLDVTFRFDPDVNVPKPGDEVIPASNSEVQVQYKEEKSNGGSHGRVGAGAGETYSLTTCPMNSSS